MNDLTPPPPAAAGPAAAPPAPPVASARPFPWFPYLLTALLGGCVLAAGLVLVYAGPGEPDLGMVREVRIKFKPGIDIDMTQWMDAIRTPDYFIEVTTEAGKIRTETMKNIKVGSGLTLKLPAPLRLVDIREIALMNKGLIKEEMVDRIDRPQREADGQKFRFTLQGEVPAPPPTHRVGMGLAIAGGAVLLLILLKFVRAQVV